MFFDYSFENILYMLPVIIIEVAVVVSILSSLKSISENVSEINKKLGGCSNESKQVGEEK